MTDRPLLNVRETAQLFGVSHRHIRRLVERDEFPQPIKLGGCVRWTRRALNKWIEDGCPKVSKADKHHA